MSNAIYTLAYNEFLGAGATRLDMDTDVVKLIGVDASFYVYSAAHTSLADVPTGARVPAGVGAAAGAALSGRSIVSRALLSSPVTLPAVAGNPFEYVVLFKYLTSDAASRLVAFYDTFAAGMPVTPNGGPIVFAPHVTGWLIL